MLLILMKYLTHGIAFSPKNKSGTIVPRKKEELGGAMRNKAAFIIYVGRPKKKRLNK